MTTQAAPTISFVRIVSFFSEVDPESCESIGWNCMSVMTLCDGFV
jgi:hypothetical protein